MQTKFTVEIRISWWFLYFYWPFLQAILWLAGLVNEDVGPNWERLEYWLKKAITVKHNRGLINGSKDTKRM